MRRYASIDDLFGDVGEFVREAARDGTFRAYVGGLEDVLPGVGEAFRRAAPPRAWPTSPASVPSYDPRSVLGVAATATPAQVKAAYRSLARRWHPDRPGGSAVKMKEINAAYEAITGGRA